MMCFKITVMILPKKNRMEEKKRNNPSSKQGAALLCFLAATQCIVPLSREVSGKENMFLTSSFSKEMTLKCTMRLQLASSSERPQRCACAGAGLHG